MRLSLEEVSTLKSALYDIDPKASLYLFGSRVDDDAKGGDIDLLVISLILAKKDLATIRWAFFDKFGEQKMDLLLDDGALNTPFAKMIFNKAIKL